MELSGTDVAEDVRCLRLPMPAYGGINAWILGGPEGQVIVDTGLPGPETAAVWDAALRDGLVTNLRSVVCTHFHIDHVGQVGRLAALSAGPMLMSQPEHQALLLLSRTSLQQRCQAADTLLQEGGFPTLGAPIPSDYSALAPVPDRVAFLEHGSPVKLGGIEFEVLTGGGHSPAAVCLLARDRKLLLVGDQMLAGSGPQVPVLAEAREDDVLGAYFDFLDRLDALPDDLIVLPGHGDPIHDFKKLVSHIRARHRSRLQRLCEAMAGTMTAAEMAPLVFSASIRERMQGRLPYLMRALTNFLEKRGLLNKQLEGHTQIFSRSI